jgi:hypothetical protein
MLVNHQVVAPGGGTIGGDWIAPLKAVHIDHAAELRLIYWKGNDALKGALRVPGAGPKRMDEGSRRATTAVKAESEGPQPTKAPAVLAEGLNGTLGFVVEGSVHLPLGGELSLCPCNLTAADDDDNNGIADCVTGGSSVRVNGTDLTMQLCKAGVCIEHIDRALTPSLLNSAPGGSANFTLLQRHGMWEFYLGGFIALPERLAAAHECLSVQATGGLAIDKVWDMTEMPPQTPVAIAPTWQKSDDEVAAHA